MMSAPEISTGDIQDLVFGLYGLTVTSVHKFDGYIMLLRTLTSYPYRVTRDLKLSHGRYTKIRWVLKKLKSEYNLGNAHASHFRIALLFRLVSEMCRERQMATARNPVLVKKFG